MTTTSYMLDNGWKQARRRLQLLEECMDPGTFRRLSGLGVGPGWRCLEVAGGAGSVARWLCSRVGPDGSVVALDLDTRFLDELQAPNLSVSRCDVVRDPLPDGGFDLVHVRALLMHLHEREEVLDRLVDAVRPGGWLLIEEPDAYPIVAVGADRLAGTWRALGRAAAPHGFSLDTGRRLPEFFHARGILDIRCEADGWFFPGASPMAEMLATSMVQLLERLDLPAGERHEADQAMADLEDPSRWFPGPALIAASGRKAN